jgi:hypothetical protein
LVERVLGKDEVTGSNPISSFLGVRNLGFRTRTDNDSKANGIR